jgi:hypothetical protein
VPVTEGIPNTPRQKFTQWNAGTRHPTVIAPSLSSATLKQIFPALARTAPTIVKLRWKVRSQFRKKYAIVKEDGKLLPERLKVFLGRLQSFKE